jgi:hypothetical protein
MAAPKLIDLEKMVQFSINAVIDGSEYQEPTVMSDGCEFASSVEIPIYQIMDSYSGKVKHLVFNETEFAISDNNVPGLRCAICRFSSKNDGRYFQCRWNTDYQQDDFLRESVIVRKLETKGR